MKLLLKTSLKKEIYSKLFKEDIKNIYLKDSTLDVNNENKNTIVELKSFIKTSGQTEIFTDILWNFLCNIFGHILG